MNVQSSNNKYRNLEYISTKISKFSNFQEYLNSISVNTAKNYKIPLEEFIDKKVDINLKNEYRKILSKKISNIFNNSFQNISDRLNMILDEIENIYLSKDMILTKEDIVFLLSLISVSSRISLKELIIEKLIKIEESKEVLIINIKNEKKYIIKKRIELFKKVFTSMSKIDESKLVSKKTENQIIDKYFYPKNNYNEKISILTLRKVLDFYFSRIME